MKNARLVRSSLFVAAMAASAAALSQGNATTPPAEGNVGTRPSFPGATGPGINPQGMSTQQGQSGSSQGSARSATQTDAAISAAVQSEMAKDPQLANSAIQVQTSSGRVSLTGQAPDAITRDRIGQLASTVRGVTMVDNRVSVGR